MRREGFNPEHHSPHAERRESVHGKLESETRRRDQLKAYRRTLETAPTTGQ